MNIRHRANSQPGPGVPGNRRSSALCVSPAATIPLSPIPHVRRPLHFTTVPKSTLPSPSNATNATNPNPPTDERSRPRILNIGPSSLVSPSPSARVSMLVFLPPPRVAAPLSSLFFFFLCSLTHESSYPSSSNARHAVALSPCTRTFALSCRCRHPRSLIHQVSLPIHQYNRNRRISHSNKFSHRRFRPP